jgi:hypothetical protein
MHYPIYMSRTALSEPIELFYAGTHTDFRRKVVTIDNPQLESAVSWFNSNNQRLPLVVGHPDSEDDHFGKGSKLGLRDGRVVVAEVEDLNPTFAKIVNSGELGRVSVKIRLPGHPANKSKGIEFQHAGFFGKSRVALDKLKEASFSEYNDLEFWFMETKKKDEEESPEEEATESLKDEEMEDAELQKKKKKLAAEMAAFENEVATFRRAQKIEPVIESWVREGRIPPASKAGLTAVFAALPEDLEISFAAGGEDVTKSASEFLAEFVGNIKPTIIYGEVSGMKDSERKATTASFSAPGMAADDDGINLIDRIAASGVDVTDTAAFSRALKQLQEV